MNEVIASFPASTGCRACLMSAICDGVNGLPDLAGCAYRDHVQCETRGWTCFCNPRLLAFRSFEVDGFQTGLRCTLDHRGAATPPLYVPGIKHGSSRESQLNEPWVALPLYTLFRSEGDSYAPVVETPQQLRQRFRLAEGVKILAQGTDEDAKLEVFWRFHQIERVAEALLAMGIDLVSVPNFSYFLDAPPLHTLYNRSRILRVTERLAAAGLQVALHLNAYLQPHWRFWEEVLRAQPFCRIVCMEFQTGLRSRRLGDNGYASLVRLQENLGRSLHPILAAGRRYLRKLPLDFQAYTVTDSTPFMRTVKRRLLKFRGGDIEWRKRLTRPEEPLDDLLSENIRLYREDLERIQARALPPQGELKLAGEFNLRGSKVAQQSKEAWELFASPKVRERNRLVT